VTRVLRILLVDVLPSRVKLFSPFVELVFAHVLESSNLAETELSADVAIFGETHSGYRSLGTLTSDAIPRRTECEAAAATGSLTTPTPNLSPRRRNLIALLAKGLTNKELGADISPRTVKAELSAVFSLFDVTNRTELVGATLFSYRRYLSSGRYGSERAVLAGAG
jgi:DNA-binding CsgD family transcriptional regulator